MLGLSLMFMIQGYFGIDHDSALYLGEILRVRFPDILGHDLFFAYGSQGRYTLFPHLIAAVLPYFDVSALFMWATAVGMLLFAGASWGFLRTLVPEGQRFLPWLTLLCLPTVYGAYRIFGYNEAFFTPRLYSEAICLLAAGLLMRQRVLAAIGCLFVAGLLHPLQTIGAGLILWTWLVLGDRRWLHVLWAMPAVLALALAGIAPFDGLLRRLDPDTLRLARTFSTHLFVAGWRAIDFQTLAFDVLVLLHAARTQTPPLQRWGLAALIGLGLGLVASLVLADLMRLVLPIELQLWRVHWLAHWFAIALVGCSLQRDLVVRDFPRVLLLALAVTLAYGRPGWAWMPFGFLYVAWEHMRTHVRQQMRTFIAIGSGLAICIFFIDYIGALYQAFREAHFQLARVPIDRAFFTFPVLSLGLALTGTMFWWRSGRPGRAVLVIAGLLPFSAYAASRWDSRPALYKALEAQAFHPRLFGVDLPRHAQVYWERASVVGPWLVLNRADYYSPQQLSGLVFSPGAAKEANDRIERLNPLRKDVQKCMDPHLDAEIRHTCRISNNAMRAACTPTAASHAPDYLILPYRQPQPALGTWSLHDPTAEYPVLTYWLYDCHDVLGATSTKP